MSDKSVVEQAIRRFKTVVDSEAQQRRREVDDLRFQVPELMWDDASRQQRAGGLVSGIGFPLPPRPILSIPKLAQPIQLVLNQQRDAHLGINVHPLSEDADRDTAEVIQGLYRKIERDSRADVSRAWAFDRAVKAGRGCYRVNVTHDDDGNPFDLKITIDRILYQSDVYLDPSAQKSDWSDGRWAFVAKWVPLDVYKEQYKKSSLAEISENEWVNAFQGIPDWATAAGEEKAILVCEYFYKETGEEEIALLDDDSYATTDKIPPGRKVKATRTRECCTVKWCKINGHEILDSEDWLGKHIPLIPVLGNELQPFDSERRFTGIIGPAKDAQRLFNFAASGAVEMAALEPRAPYVMDPRQVEGFEAYWQQSNTRNFPYLPYNSIIEGQPLPPPTRVQVDAGRLGPSMMLLQQADAFIQSATATFNPSLGRTDPKERSGRAILAQQQQTDAATSNFLQQLADVMHWEATVVLDLFRPVYGARPGRIEDILTGEDESRNVMLNIPFTMNSDGRPERVQMDNAMPPGVKEYHLDRGTYGVSISVGKSYQSRLQEGADEIGQILQAQPELIPLIGATYFRFRDFPGAQEISDILRKVRDKQYPGVSGDEDEEPGPDELKSKLAAAGQQVQMLQAQLKQAIQALETEQVKQQAMLEKAQLDNKTRLMIEQMKIQNEQAIARLEVAQKALEAALDREHERDQSGADRKHEAALGAAEASMAQQAMQAGHEQENAAMQAGQQHEIAKGAADAGAAFDLAALKPTGETMGGDE